MPESQFAVVASIIERSRRVHNLRPLNDSDLAATVDAWIEVIGDIPAGRIDECYRRVMRERQFKTALQPAELLQAWRDIAGAERNLRTFVDPRNVTDNTYRCLYCQDHGYQHVRIHRGGDYWTICARPCVCDAAPAAHRSEHPLQPPEWESDAKGEWTRVRSFARSAR